MSRGASGGRSPRGGSKANASETPSRSGECPITYPFEGQRSSSYSVTFIRTHSPWNWAIASFTVMRTPAVCSSADTASSMWPLPVIAATPLLASKSPVGAYVLTAASSTTPRTVTHWHRTCAYTTTLDEEPRAVRTTDTRRGDGNERGTARARRFLRRRRDRVHRRDGERRPGRHRPGPAPRRRIPQPARHRPRPDIRCPVVVGPPPQPTWTKAAAPVRRRP